MRRRAKTQSQEATQNPDPEQIEKQTPIEIENRDNPEFVCQDLGEIENEPMDSPTN
jgi:hypothetical protein